MQLTLKDNLPFIRISLTYRTKTITINHVLVDTGSVSTILSADRLIPLDISPSPDDLLYTIRGVGGSEAVFTRQIDSLQVGRHGLNDFVVEIGGMDYGFEIDGILGMDFLTQAGAVINLHKKTITFARKEI